MRATAGFILALLVPGVVAFAQTADRLSPTTQRFVRVADPVVALTNVRVIDGTGAAPLETHTIVLTAGRISALGPAAAVAVPAGASVLDLTGHTVLPGLVGLHNHTFYTTSARRTQLSTSAPLLYLASGVTTIRTTGSSSPYSELNLKRSIETGEWPGPRMYVTGPYLTGPQGRGHMHQVLDPESARRVVAYWAEEGASWLKFYTRISRATLGAAIDEAHKRGLKVTGHLCSVSFREAVALGIDNLEHGLFVSTDFNPDKEPDLCPPNNRSNLDVLDIDSPSVRELFETLIDNNVAITSTLAVYELYVPNRPPLEERVLRAMSPETRAEYLASRARLAEPGASGITPQMFENAQRFEYAFVKAGGLLAAGVDPTGNGGALPGYGDQRNFELLLEAGFTPEEAIRIMTLNGARVLGTDRDFGSVAVGKRADLVVVAGNPAATPQDIRNVTLVFKDGVGYDSAKLAAETDGLVGIR